MRTLLLLLIASLTLLTTQAQKKIVLRPAKHKVDSVKHYQKILIVGEGGLQARMYMDNLTTELIKALKTRHIECKYEYLGDVNKVNTDEALKKALAWPHDAVLRFFPVSTSEKARVRATSVAPMAGGGYIPSGMGIQQFLVNDFDITLNEGSETVWSAQLFTSIEFGKITVYRRIRKVILDDMARQNVLPD